MGMCIEVKATVTYTVRLTDEEIKLVRKLNVLKLVQMMTIQ